MLFPWKRVTAGVVLLYLVSMFVYRISHVGGEDVSLACFAALLTALIAGMLSVYPVSKYWGHDQWRILLGYFWGFLIRVLIITLGSITITFFADINRIAFVLFLKLYYIFFLFGDVWLVLWMMRHSKATKETGL